jgi:hypothetical protein
MAKKKKSADGAAPAAKKRNYASATERVINNLESMQKCAGIVRERFAAWIKYAPEGDKAIAKIEGHRDTLDSIDQQIAELHEGLSKLFESFTPPKPVKKTNIEVGDTVKIAKKYRDKYEKAYSSANLDKLTVEDIDDSFITVHDEESDTRFMVKGKAHLALVRDSGDEDADE